MQPWIHRSNSTVVGYQISRSLRFRSGNSASLAKTPAGAGTGGGKTWTSAFWVKRGAIGASGIQGLHIGDTGAASTRGGIYFGFYNGSIGTGSDNLSIYSTSYANSVTTTQVFRDTNAWYHVVVAVDTTQSTASNRVKMYINGVQVTSFSNSTYPTLNYVFGIGQNIVTAIGSEVGGNYFDGYLSDFYFIDGQQLTPSSFGQIDATTGVWSPIAYTGTYGTNGFHLDFSDNSAATAAAIGADRSGAGNNWTPSGISITAGVTNDSLVDSPTSYGTDTGAGGEVRGDYCTLNPLATSGVTPNNANLRASVSAAFSVLGTMAPDGLFYWEDTETYSTQGYGYVGVQLINTALNAAASLAAINANQYVWRDDANKANNGTSSAYGTALTSGQTIMVAYNKSTGNLWFGSQGTWFGSGNPATGANPAYTLPAGSDVLPLFGSMGATGADTHDVNFGQRPFAFTAPAGFKALCSQNQPAPAILKPNQYFNPVLYTGTGAARSITGVGFQPDLTWIKSRSGAFDNALLDSVRGAGKYLYSNLTSAEASFPTDFASFDADGFSFGAGSGTVDNGNGSTYVAWNWKKGATPGFDIVTYTGTGVNRTVAHALGAIPTFMVVRDKSAASNWAVYHSANGNTKYQHLNATIAATVDATVWNSTTPTSSVFSVGTNGWVNTNGDAIIAYLFTDVPGFSKFGSYTGNGSTDGPFVYCGFRPRFVLVKRTDTADNWRIYDTARDSVNVEASMLSSNGSGAESSLTFADILSNGFKLRGTDTSFNASGGTYIFAAFAEAPFKYSRAR